MDQFQIAFLISTFPGMLLSLFNWANPDMESFHKLMTACFCILWLTVFLHYIHTFRGTA